jgi:4-hydroxy 2-oxovalerate aldolase
MESTVLLDCTLRDGGYYNAWDFSPQLITSYLVAMKAAQVDIVELGFRFMANNGFKGACAYATDDFIRTLDIPAGLTVAVMVNGGDLLTDLGLVPSLERLFPETTETSPVELVRFACHFHEFEQVLPAVGWLTERGYRVGFNLMQIADRSREDVLHLARKAKEWPVEVLYFADSMGSMTPADAAKIVGWLKEEWDGPIGIHTHDNMGLALANTLSARDAGATWLDATVTGMGRGPGNARTEELVIEAEDFRQRKASFVPLMALIRKHFGPMKEKHGWGSNPYYYLSGKYGLHPTYIQEMLGDARFDEEDILAVIDYLRVNGGKKFSHAALGSARNFYDGPPAGTWAPASELEGRDVLLLGTGPGVEQHRVAIEALIARQKPVVVALNTQEGISPDLIDLRVACHPVRLLADCETHLKLSQPLITPVSMMPDMLKESLAGKELRDFGISVRPDTFEFHDTYCVTPTSLVLSYALAITAAGKARRVLLAGFDGYPAGDPRNDETAEIFKTFQEFSELELLSVTQSKHVVNSASIYGIL